MEISHLLTAVSSKMTRKLGTALAVVSATQNQRLFSSSAVWNGQSNSARESCLWL